MSPDVIVTKKNCIIVFHIKYPNGSIDTDYKIEGTSAIVTATIVPNIVEIPQRYFTAHAIGPFENKLEDGLEKIELQAVYRCLYLMGIITFEALTA